MWPVIGSLEHTVCTTVYDKSNEGFRAVHQNGFVRTLDQHIMSCLKSLRINDFGKYLFEVEYNPDVVNHFVVRNKNQNVLCRKRLFN